jgi:hypothetical protein
VNASVDSYLRRLLVRNAEGTTNDTNFTNGNYIVHPYSCDSCHSWFLAFPFTIRACNGLQFVAVEVAKMSCDPIQGLIVTS